MASIRQKKHITTIFFRYVLPVLILVIILFSVASWFAYQTYTHTIYNLTAWDRNFDGLNKEELTQHLDDIFTKFSQEKFSIITPGQDPIIMTASDLGIYYDTKRIAKALYLAGKEGSFLEKIQFRIASLLHPTNKVFQPIINKTNIKTKLTLELHKYWKAPQDTRIVYLWGKFDIISGKAGYVFELDHAIKQIQTAAYQLRGTDIHIFPQKQEPDISRDLALTQLHHLYRILPHQLLFHFADQTWRLNLSQVPEWIDVQKVIRDQKPNLLISIKKKEFFNFLDEYIHPDIEQLAVHPQLILNQDKQAVLSDIGRRGQHLLYDQTYQNLLTALNSEKYSIDLAVQIEKVKVTSNFPNNYGIETLLAEGVSSYAGSRKNRIHNILLSLKNYNNLLIPPDDEFVFGEYLGIVDDTTGYKKELVITDGGTRAIPEYGGGICQVSTTLFRAALNSGADITRRRPHSYAVSYYDPPGLDATVYPPKTDFQFKNNTSNYIMLQTAVDEDTQTIRFLIYGTDDGRQVHLSTTGPYNTVDLQDPVYQDTPKLAKGETKPKPYTQHKIGYEIAWTRQVSYPDGRQTEDKFYSHYRALPTVLLRGTKINPRQ